MNILLLSYLYNPRPLSKFLTINIRWRIRQGIFHGLCFCSFLYSSLSPLYFPLLFPLSLFFSFPSGPCFRLPLIVFIHFYFISPSLLLRAYAVLTRFPSSFNLLPLFSLFLLSFLNINSTSSLSIFFLFLPSL